MSANAIADDEHFEAIVETVVEDCNEKVLQRLLVELGQLKLAHTPVVDTSGYKTTIGATAGLAIGSILPGIGTLIGVAAGAIIGHEQDKRQRELQARIHAYETHVNEYIQSVIEQVEKVASVALHDRQNVVNFREAFEKRRQELTLVSRPLREKYNKPLSYNGYDPQKFLRDIDLSLDQVSLSFAALETRGIDPQTFYDDLDIDAPEVLECRDFASLIWCDGKARNDECSRVLLDFIVRYYDINEYKHPLSYKFLVERTFFSKTDKPAPLDAARISEELATFLSTQPQSGDPVLDAAAVDDAKAMIKEFVETRLPELAAVQELREHFHGKEPPERKLHYDRNENGDPVPFLNTHYADQMADGRLTLTTIREPRFLPIFHALKTKTQKEGYGTKVAEWVRDNEKLPLKTKEEILTDRRKAFSDILACEPSEVHKFADTTKVRPPKTADLSR